jgi:acetate kinase
MVCDHLTYLGVELDKEINDMKGKEIEISKPGSKVKVWCVPTNEELMIARDTVSI